MRKPDPKLATITNPQAWDQSHGTYISGRASIDGVDAVAVEMERKWGCDRLRLIVSREMRERFDRQRYKLSMAIRNGTLIEVQTECQRMMFAWAALDTEATGTGKPQLVPEVWEIALEDGTVAAIVQTAAEAHKVVTDGRRTAVYTLDEIGRLLHAFPQVAKLKKLYPGASVERVEKTIRDPLNDIRQATGFDDPLDDLFGVHTVN